MNASTHTAVPTTSFARLSTIRATLRTRPLIQRALIRSWEYRRPIRSTLLALRMLVTLWLVFVGGALLSGGYTWGVALFPAAAAVAAISIWVFATAAKGWPVAGA